MRVARPREFQTFGARRVEQQMRLGAPEEPRNPEIKGRPRAYEPPMSLLTGEVDEENVAHAATDAPRGMSGASDHTDPPPSSWLENAVRDADEIRPPIM